MKSAEIRTTPASLRSDAQKRNSAAELQQITVQVSGVMADVRTVVCVCSGK